jgi:hypothetical protein
VTWRRLPHHNDARRTAVHAHGNVRIYYRAPERGGCLSNQDDDVMRITSPS